MFRAKRKDGSREVFGWLRYNVLSGAFEIEQIAKHYRKKAKELAKEKGIKI